MGDFFSFLILFEAFLPFWPLMWPTASLFTHHKSFFFVVVLPWSGLQLRFAFFEAQWH